MMKLIALLVFVLSAAAVAGQEESARTTVSAPTAGEAWTSPLSGMEFLWIQTLDLWVAKYETTNGEYRLKKPDHNSGSFMDHSLDGDRQPVVNVNFIEAFDYGEWMTGKEQELGKLPDGYHYRLPSEDEWLVFARCGEEHRYPWGKDWPPAYGNYRGQEAQGRGEKIEDYDDGHVVTSNVEESGRNQWGLYGVGGNVWEAATRDCGDENCKACGSWRGGSWDTAYEGLLRCTYRSTGILNYRFNNYGFRLVLARDD